MAEQGAGTVQVEVPAAIWRSGDYFGATRYLKRLLERMPETERPEGATDWIAACFVVFLVLHGGFETCLQRAGSPEPDVQLDAGLRGLEAAGAWEFRALVGDMVAVFRAVYGIELDQVPSTDFDELFRSDEQRYARFLAALSPLHVQAYELDSKQSLRAPLWQRANAWPHLKIAEEAVP